MKFNSKYLKSAVLGANDGIVTTFAVVAGVAGAGLSADIIIILGIANMFADGLSMGLGDFLGERSEEAYKVQQNGGRLPRDLWKPGLINFLSFVAAGSMPLMPYFLRAAGVPIDPAMQFPLSIAATGVTLFTVGSLRSLILHRAWWKNGLEMLAIGSIAAVVAYLLGGFIERTII